MANIFQKSVTVVVKNNQNFHHAVFFKELKDDDFTTSLERLFQASAKDDRQFIRVLGRCLELETTVLGDTDL